jgi:hypothetical protein
VGAVAVEAQVGGSSGAHIGANGIAEGAPILVGVRLGKA